jgi:MFS transporter, CP family, cyanate transporter
VKDRRAVVAVAGVAIVLTALNLRPAIPSVGALLREVQHATGMSSSTAGLLTSLPPVCFGVFGLAGGWLGRRFGTTTMLLAGMGLTTVGLLARVTSERPWLMVALTVPALAGLAFSNVLVPVAVKRWFPRHIGRATGVYSLCLSLGMATAAALSVPVAELAGTWRAGLGIWGLTALLAIPAWVWLRRQETLAAAVTAANGVKSKRTSRPSQVAEAGSMRRSPKAWALAGFFGLQSLAAYVLFGWLPTIYQDAGISARGAGLLLALVIGLGVPISLLLPELASKRDDQRPFVVGLAAAAAAGYIGLLIAPLWAPWLWASLLGVGMGSFPLALLLIGLRARSSATTAQLSGLVQGAGYLIAASGPFAIGALHDFTGGWALPLMALIVLLVPQLWCGWIIARPGHVDPL